ncbi:hypothetical protein ACWDO0_28265 [Nocardia rhamnosiphila]
MADDQHLPLSVRIEQLFDTFHARTEPEQSMDAVAASVSKALGGRAVTAEHIAALRTGEHDTIPADADLLTALAEHFEVPPGYLLLDGDSAVNRINQQLRLLAAARNAGVRHVELRGTEVEIEALIAQFEQVADRIPPDRPA